MDKVIHAHKLLNFLMDTEKKYTKEELKIAVSEKFGDGIKFTNCTGNIYSLNEILTFFEERNKIMVSEKGISVNKEEICSH